MRKKLLPALCLCLLLFGCSRPPAEPASGVSTLPVETPPQSLKLGLATVTTVSKSQNATPDFPGVARTDITMAAVTVDESGIIHQCILDGITGVIPFDATGALQAPEDLSFHSKNELGDSYGMHKASPMGKEWDQQAASFAAYAVGKRVDELHSGDVAASVTVDTDSFLQAICAAVQESSDLGTQEGDRLALSSDACMDNSRSADSDAGQNGSACCSAVMGAVTFRGEKITACRFDGVETNLPFTPDGIVSTNVSLPQLSKDILADAYGIRRCGAEGKCWYQQANAFAATTIGLTAQQVSRLPREENLPSPDGSAAHSIERLQLLTEKAWQQTAAN